MRCVSILQVTLLLAEEQLDVEQLMEVDEDCGEGECALHALQVRGKRLASESAQSRHSLSARQVPSYYCLYQPWLPMCMAQPQQSPSAKQLPSGTPSGFCQMYPWSPYCIQPTAPVASPSAGYIPPVQPQYSAPQAPQYAPQYVPQSTAPMSQLRLTRRGGLDPPAKVDTYNGGAWEVLKLPGKRSMHFFALGDWGGLLGTGYAPMIQYRSGQTPGPHTMARWRGPCKTDKMIACFAGDTCEQSCHYDPQVDRQAQVLVATQMKKRAAQSQPDFIVNVGDNFYWGGINTECGTPMNQISAVTQQQFTEIFEKIYGGPGLDGKPWLSVLGNHDWGGYQFNKAWDQQIAYTWASDRWRLPALYWMQRVEYPDLDFSAEIFMIDSNAMDVKPMHADPEHNICGQLHNPTNARCDATGGPANLKDCFSWMWSLWREQKKWVQQKLTESNANWQIVATHFNCGHEAQWYKELHQKYGLDLLITGHTHDQQVYHESGMLGGLTCFITGGGGGITSEADPSHPKSNQYGFFDISITKQQILLESINYRGETLGKYAVRPKARAL